MHDFALAAAALLVLAAADARAQDLPEAEAFAPGPGRVWLSGCAVEADRYVTCKDAARPLLDAIAAPGTGTPGAALEAFMRTLFTEKGCTYAAPPDTFRVNGIFLSFDSKHAERIRCPGQSSALVFRPGAITLLDTLYFLAGGPPR